MRLVLLAVVQPTLLNSGEICVCDSRIASKVHAVKIYFLFRFCGTGRIGRLRKLKTKGR